MTAPLLFSDPNDWSSDADELHRTRDPVAPALELRLGSDPDAQTLTRLADAMVSAKLTPQSTWESVLVSGCFVRIIVPGRTPRKIVEKARAALPSLSKAAGVVEAALLVPLTAPPLDVRGPAWPGWRVRAVDEALPEPSPHPVLESVFRKDERREALHRMGLVAVYGEPKSTGNLATLVDEEGTDFQDDGGHTHRILELVSWEQPAAGHIPYHIRLMGLLADGRFALIASSAKKDKPFDLSEAPRRAWPLAQRRRDVQPRVDAALRKRGLDLAFDPTPLLREVLSAFDGGAGLHESALSWLAASPLADDPATVALLQRHRSDPYVGTQIDEFLSRNDPAPPKIDKKARRAEKKRKRRANRR